MPEFVLNRNHTMRSLYGHIVNFKKGEPVYVPPICAREAASIGAECVDGKVDPLGDEEVAAPPMPPEERQENIIAAFKIMQERTGQEAYRSDFTANGAPAKGPLVALLGFEVDKKEYEPLWKSFRVERAE